MEAWAEEKEGVKGGGDRMQNEKRGTEEQMDHK
jgi:hypothetical protein